jgi:hypothetical protein
VTTGVVSCPVFRRTRKRVGGKRRSGVPVEDRMTIVDLGEELIKRGCFIYDALDKPEEYDVDALADLLIEGGYALCPKCARWCHGEDLQHENPVCNECKTVEEMKRVGALL